VNQVQGGFAVMEDALAGDLLDRLNESPMPGPGVAEVSEGEAGELLLRSYVEVVGLLPYALAPMEPSPATKERLLARLDGVDKGSYDDKEGEVSAVSPMRGAGGWRSWALPLAAGLVFALVGLSGWQRLHVERQQVEIARLSDHLREENLQSAELARFRQELGEAQAKLAVLSSSGVEVCRLHPMEERLAGTSLTATLFVAPDRQRWYLGIAGLEPGPEDRDYQPWFTPDDGAQVSAGTFEPRPGVRIELTSGTMPGGTVAVSVTLEPLGGSPAPSSSPLLYGDEVMRIL